MSRGGVKIVVTLLGVLTMVTLAACQPKDAFFQNGVLLVPESKTEAEPALAVTNAEETVLPPPVGTGTSVVMGEVVPAAEERREGCK